MPLPALRVLGPRILAAFLLLAAASVLVGPAVAKPVAVAVSPLPHVARTLAEALPLRIVAFGSSSTEGVGASSPAASYPARLQVWLRAALPVPVVVLNAGIGGQDADDMLRRIDRVLAGHPDLVIWQTGSNDPLRGVSLARFDAETRAGIAVIRATGADVMLMEPQDCKVLRARPGALAYRDDLRRIAAELRVPLVRRYDLMDAWLAEGLLTRAQLLYGDGLHMTDGGYARLAIAVGQQIVALLGRHAGVLDADGGR
jgi:acyl-CoA thioesterase-1